MFPISKQGAAIADEPQPPASAFTRPTDGGLAFAGGTPPTEGLDIAPHIVVASRAPTRRPPVKPFHICGL